jgi:hypothetical protein
MSNQQSPQEAFLEIMREELGLPELSFDEAIKKPLAKTLYATLSRQGAKLDTRVVTAPAITDFIASVATIKAAVQDTYVLEEIRPTDAERSALLACSDVVMLNGQRRLRLNDKARGEFLTKASNTPFYLKLLQDAVIADQNKFDAIGKDPVRLPTAWLRSFLANEFGSLNPTSAPLRELSAARSARERLRFVDFLPKSVPSIADLDRRKSA